MESSELFLIGWAILATIVAVYCQHRTKVLSHRIKLFELSLLAIAHNKAEVVIKGESVQVRGV
jgi:hypothetical protein